MLSSAVGPAASFDDLDFDRLLPNRLRQLADVHFTPVDVARRAAQLLAPAAGARVLDVGAGVGKLCLVAALATPNATFVGIERRRPLVRIARALARRLAATNAAFLHGDATEVDWAGFDAFYLFNPFAEHLRDGTPALDEAVELDPGYFPYYVDVVRHRLAAAALGTRVVTYHGFGGGPPAGYALSVDESAGTQRLQLWIKMRPARTRRATEEKPDPSPLAPPGATGSHGPKGGSVVHDAS